MSGISVEVLPDVGPPQVGVTVDGLPAGSVSTVTIERSTDGVSWSPVRGAVAVSVSGAGFWRDHVAPLNVPVTYRVTGASTLAFGERAATITVPSAVAWIQDPLAPRTAVPVSDLRSADGIVLQKPSLGDLSRVLPADVVQVQGARLPVASLGVRQAPSGIKLHLRGLTASQGVLMAALSALVETAGTVVLRGLPASIPLDPVAHVIAPEVTDSPLVGGLLGPRRDWQMTVTQVRAPSPRISVPWWTYDQVRALWDPATYDLTVAARPEATYLDWLRDPSPAASTTEVP